MTGLKMYFAVDTQYVLKKLMLLLFPYTHQDWSPKYQSDQPIPAREDINAPDLYIPGEFLPLMGFLFLWKVHLINHEQD